MSETNPEREGQSRLRRSAPLVVSAIALAVAAGGIGAGANALITGSQVRDGSLTGADIRSGSIGGDDIRAGSIQVSDLSRGAVNGLDGKDGAQGPAGPAGAQGPAGPAGPAGPGGGGLVVKDASGATVVNAYNPTVNWDAGGTVSSFYLYKNGQTYKADGNSGVVAEAAAHPEFIFQTGACGSPVDSDFWVAQSDLVAANQLVANPKAGFRSTPAYFRATATTTPATGGYDGIDSTDCRNWVHPSGTLVKLTPADAPVPLVTLPTPFHVVLEDTTY